jgi:hypothetical protein
MPPILSPSLATGEGVRFIEAMRKSVKSLAAWEPSGYTNAPELQRLKSSVLTPIACSPTTLGPVPPLTSASYGLPVRARRRGAALARCTAEHTLRRFAEDKGILWQDREHKSTAWKGIVDGDDTNRYCSSEAPMRRGLHGHDGGSPRRTPSLGSSRISGLSLSESETPK